MFQTVLFYCHLASWPRLVLLFFGPDRNRFLGVSSTSSTVLTTHYSLLVDTGACGGLFENAHGMVRVATVVMEGHVLLQILDGRMWRSF